MSTHDAVTHSRATTVTARTLTNRVRSEFIRVFRGMSNIAFFFAFSLEQKKKKKGRKRERKNKREVDAQTALRNDFHSPSVPSGEVGNINLLERQRFDSEYSMPIRERVQLNSLTLMAIRSV